jgi:glutamate-1-semialdehyde 2,1-aminomutase
MQILVKFLYEAVRPSTCDKLFHLVITQAGTLSGNPLAMTAGLKTLEILDRPGAYEHLEKITGRLIEGILQAGRDAGHAVTGGHISGKS